MRHGYHRLTALCSGALAAIAWASAAVAAGGAVQDVAVSSVTATEWVVTADGVRLATDVYFPVGQGFGPWAVVLQRTPYGRQGEGAASVCLNLVLQGFACVAQDVRGTGDSTGTNAVFRRDREDGQTTLEWIARQRWCNGRIGTFGASALGITQYALAPAAPAALACQVPTVATMDFFHHAAFWGGSIRYGLIHPWLAGQDSLWFYDEVRGHRTWDSWWQEVAVLPHLRDIQAPGLHVGGWYDIFLQGTLDAFTALQHNGGERALNRQHLVVGPWVHTGIGMAAAGELQYPTNAATLVDLLEQMRNWYRYHLQDRRREVEAWPAVRIYLMGAVGEPGAPGNQWVEFSDWPPPATNRPLYLGTSRELGDAPGVSGELEMRADPVDPVPTRGGGNLFETVDGVFQGIGPYDQRPVEARTDVLVFSTPVLPSPLPVVGRLRCRLWVRPDTRDFDIAVRLTDVYPDGSSMLVADGIQRARFRCGDAGECLAVPGQPVEIEVDLWSTAVVFNRGHRIRIIVSGSNWPRFEVNRNTGGDLNGTQPAVVARPRILLGGSFPSRLDVPVLRSSPFPRRVLGR